MARRRIEGFWTCSYCGAKGIGGLTKTCPNCGNPQAKGLKFEVKGGSKKYLSPEIAENYGKGADWVCAYCGSYNRYNDEVCRNCASEKATAESDYFGRKVTSRESSSPCNEEESGDNSHHASNDMNHEANYHNDDDEKSDANNIQNPFRKINWKVVFGMLGGAATIITIVMFLSL